MTTDPKELRKLAGLRSVSEVYRTLDKLAIRKEYHAALARHGLDLDSIVRGLKEIVEDSKDNNIKLKAYLAILKSIGLDSYNENDGGASKSWEDVLKDKIEKKEELFDGTTKAQELIDAPDYQEYDVDLPETPDDEKKKEEEENKEGSELYETQKI